MIPGPPGRRDPRPSSGRPICPISRFFFDTSGFLCYQTLRNRCTKEGKE